MTTALELSKILEVPKNLLYSAQYIALSAGLDFGEITTKRQEKTVSFLVGKSRTEVSQTSSWEAPDWNRDQEINLLRILLNMAKNPKAKNKDLIGAHDRISQRLEDLTNQNL